ncbi:hypothetical protein [Rhizobium sp. BK251]|nr:hypothetical protein [Rhizobium sp. BK251]
MITMKSLWQYRKGPVVCFIRLADWRNATTIFEKVKFQFHKNNPMVKT